MYKQIEEGLSYQKSGLNTSWNLHCFSGPLLYHFENIANELSVELSYEDIKKAMITFGFHIEVNQRL